MLLHCSVGMQNLNGQADKRVEPESGRYLQLAIPPTDRKQLAARGKHKKESDPEDR